ncbi:hypothetical protein F5050DRAFT_1809947 [Lentinula boryana]|uniref:Uncharacterized protein n=1 Tax=Lentinula boryana TaxID=40481 RepID=A0ABQ8Q6H9_9AGAR|nr:hypothetical protein F5050DRAFT_1809947 [Lentinula boryana]
MKKELPIPKTLRSSPIFVSDSEEEIEAWQSADQKTQKRLSAIASGEKTSLEFKENLNLDSQQWAEATFGPGLSPSKPSPSSSRTPVHKVTFKTLKAEIQQLESKVQNLEIASVQKDRYILRMETEWQKITNERDQLASDLKQVEAEMKGWREKSAMESERIKECEGRENDLKEEVTRLEDAQRSLVRVCRKVAMIISAPLSFSNGASLDDIDRVIDHRPYRRLPLVRRSLPLTTPQDDIPVIS